ncbi:hypothetical protein [Piscinibacter sp. HJYY11]|uniref:hypothetical protein n=1 Tax=Piscinibacter sp. HJYY11 TaxID=2801333 RepID=UPI00191D4959|nr:hypothetical protein [Piscinibacter sp. HJYY11]MBL0729635.1 hypothetical protein [Piscinibacter sp. HJYY11]
MKNEKKFSAETADLAVEQVLRIQDKCRSQWAAIQVVASSIGCHTETLRLWVRKAERSRDWAADSSVKELLERLNQEVAELRRYSDLLKETSEHLVQVLQTVSGETDVPMIRALRKIR